MATVVLGNVSLPFIVAVRGINGQASDGSPRVNIDPPFTAQIVNSSGTDVSSAFSISIAQIGYSDNIGQISEIVTATTGFNVGTQTFVKIAWTVDLIGTPTGPGPFTLKAKFKAYDDSFTYNVEENFQFVYDSTAPTVTITPPSGIVTVGGINYSKNNPEIISISAVDNSGGTGVKHITPTLDGTAMSAVSGSSTNVSVTGEGSHTISATSEDNAGNISSPVSYTFFIDSIDPTGDVTLSSAQDIFDVGGLEYVNVSSPELEFTFADSGSGVDEIEINLNGSAYATYTGLSSPYTESISSAIEGQNTIEYIIKDVAGNELTVNYDFYVDTTDPDGYIVISTQDEIRENGGVLYTKETNVNVDLHFGDSGTDPSGISKGLIKINDSSPPVVADFSSGIDLSSETSPKLDHNVTGLTSGQSNDLSFFVIDNVEQISAGDTVSVYVDQTDPTGTIDISSSQEVHIYSGDGITYSNTVNILLELTHSDSESGLF